MGEPIDAREFLALAQEELQGLASMDDPSVVSEEAFGRRVQQAVEKALKAWIAALGLECPVRHDLAELFSILEEEGSEVGPFWRLVRFAPFSVQFEDEDVRAIAPPEDRPAARGEVRTLLLRVEGVIARAEGIL